MEPNFEALRKEFPVLERKTYLNSGSYCALANEVKSAFEAYMEDRLLVGANWDVWVTKNESVRSLVAELLNAAPDEIAVTASVSAGLNALASALDFSGPRNKVVVSDFEFPTNAQIWHAQEPRGAKVVHVPRAADGYIPARAVRGRHRRAHTARRHNPRLLSQRREARHSGHRALGARQGCAGAARLLPVGGFARHRREGAGCRLRGRRDAQVPAGYGGNRISVCARFAGAGPRAD